MHPLPAPAAVRSAGLTAILLLALGSTAAAPMARSAATGSVEGFVRDGSGQPVAGARVTVAGTALGAGVDSTGHYLLRALPAGRARLRAEAPGYGPSEAEVTVRPGATVRRDLVLSLVAKPLAEMAKASGQVSRRKDIAHADALMAPSAAPEPWRQRREQWNTEAYARIEENRFLNAAANPVSTFSIDVDAASYSNVRRFLAQGTLPPADAVRLEELVNYFPYHYPDRAGEHPFGLIADVGPCPWADDHRLVRVALQARRVDTRELPPSNLVFLIDVSGSMQSPDKLPLVQRAFRALVQELRPEDRVAIVVYAGAAGLVLPSTPGTTEGGDPGRDRSPGGGRQHRGRRRTPAGLRRGARALPVRGEQPRHPGHRRRLQRRGELRCGDDPPGGAAPGGGDLPDRAGVRHRQPEGHQDGADGRSRERPLRLHRLLQRGPQGLRAGVRRNAVHRGQGREDPGRVQSRPGPGVPAAGLREPAARPGGLRRRPEGRRRARGGSGGDGAVRSGAGWRRARRAGGRQSHLSAGVGAPVGPRVAGPAHGAGPVQGASGVHQPPADSTARGPWW